jgi:hypothetical protein
MRYRIELDELSTFVEKLRLFEERAETIANAGRQADRRSSFNVDW